MNKVLVFMVLMLIPSVTVVADPVTLPDYNKEAKLSVHATCDGKKISVDLYEHDKYRLIIVLVANGDTYYNLENDTSSFFFLKKDGFAEPQQMQEQEWNNSLSNESSSVFMLLHATFIPQGCKLEK